MPKGTERKNTDDNLGPVLAEVHKIKERLNMLKEVLSDIEEHYATSPKTDGQSRQSRLGAESNGTAIRRLGKGHRKFRRAFSK